MWCGVVYALACFLLQYRLCFGQSKNVNFTCDISFNGIWTISSPTLINENRGDELVNIVVTAEYGRDERRTTGPAKGTIMTRLEYRKKYEILISSTMNSKSSFEVRLQVKNVPTCPRGSFDGDKCRWLAASSSNWDEAEVACATVEGGHIGREFIIEDMDPCLYYDGSGKTDFWIAIHPQSDPDVVQKIEQAGCSPSGGKSCCGCITKEDTDENLMCGLCCEEKLRYHCESPYQTFLGEIKEASVNWVQAHAIHLSWTADRKSEWGQSGYMITCVKVYDGGKEDVLNSKLIFVEGFNVTIWDLSPSTKYRIQISPCLNRVRVQGESQSIDVITENAETAEEIQGIIQVQCTVSLMKAISSATVVLGSFITIIVFITSKTLYNDSVAHLFSDISLIAAYLCVSTSSAQSYLIDKMCLFSGPKICTGCAIMIQFFFQSSFLFSMLEIFEMGQVLDNGLFPELPSHLSLSVGSMFFYGFGIPAAMLTVSAVVGSEEFSVGTKTCWLNLHGKAVLPSVIPIVVFIALELLLLIPLLIRDQYARNMFDETKVRRAKIMQRTRWVSLVLLILTAGSWLTGMLGTATNVAWMNYVYFAFTMALGICLPVLKIGFEDSQVWYRIRRLFQPVSRPSSKVRPQSQEEIFEQSPKEEKSNPKSERKKSLKKTVTFPGIHDAYQSHS